MHERVQATWRDRRAARAARRRERPAGEGPRAGAEEAERAEEPGEVDLAYEEALAEDPPVAWRAVPPGYLRGVPPDAWPEAEVWDDGLEDPAPDTTRSRSLGRGCLVAWHCRRFPRPNPAPGCEAGCLWTREQGAARPACFGFFEGRQVLDGGALADAVARLCGRCVHGLACAAEARYRFGGARR